MTTDEATPAMVARDATETHAQAVETTMSHTPSVGSVPASDAETDSPEVSPEGNSEEVEVGGQSPDAIETIDTTAVSTASITTVGGKKDVVYGKGQRPEMLRVDKAWSDMRWKTSPTGMDVKTYGEYAFLVQRNHTWDAKFINVTVIIHSPQLRTILRKALNDVKGMSLVGEVPEVESNMLYLFLGEIQDVSESLPSDSTEEMHSRLLIDYLVEDYTEIKTKIRPMIENGTIEFEFIWALFRPGTIAFQEARDVNEEDFAFTVDYVSKEEPLKQEKDYQGFYRIEGHYLTFDGTNFGYRDVSVHIDKFKGTREIHKLQAYPLQHCKDASMGTKLRDRGERLVHLQQRTEYQYDGLATSANKQILSVQGRIVVDQLGYGEENGFPGHMTSLGVNVSDSFTVEQLQMASPYTLGFSMRQKQWARFKVGCIRNVERREKAWASLVLADSSKKRLEQLITYINKHGQASADIIEGKGQGFLVVLHGSPGCGKTLTAEAVAERLGVPLYSVSAADIGVKAEDVAKNLQEIFNRAYHWKAIILLDEADTFVQSRLGVDMRQQAAISALIRELEQYRGFMFLTTNHVRTFDAAVISRAHFLIEYKDLTVKERAKIWNLFIQRVENQIAPEEIKDIAGRECINGREIKNCVRIGHVMAFSEGRPLRMDDIIRVLNDKRDILGLPEFVRNMLN